MRRPLRTLIFIPLLLGTAFFSPLSYKPFLCGGLLQLYCLQDYSLPPSLGKDMILHHILTQWLTLGIMCYPQLPWEYVQVFINTEYSTFPLIFRDLGISHSINSLVFIITFTYFRIFQLGKLIFHLILKNELWSLPFLMSVPVTGLYAINLYWYYKIGRLFSRIHLLPRFRHLNNRT